MKPSNLLRVAFALALLELAGHTFLIFSFVPKHGIAEETIIAAMKSQAFSFSGSYRTYWDMYFGYELFVSLSLIVESLILWQLFHATAMPGTRAIAGVLALGEAGYALLMIRYFFIIPIASHTAMAILLSIAWYSLPNPRRELH